MSKFATALELSCIQTDGHTGRHSHKGNSQFAYPLSELEAKQIQYNSPALYSISLCSCFLCKQLVTNPPRQQLPLGNIYTGTLVKWGHLNKPPPPIFILRRSPSIKSVFHSIHFRDNGSRITTPFSCKCYLLLTPTRVILKECLIFLTRIQIFAFKGIHFPRHTGFIQLNLSRGR